MIQASWGAAGGQQARGAGHRAVTAAQLKNETPVCVDRCCLQETPARQVPLGHDWSQQQHGPSSWAATKQHGVLVGTRRRGCWRGSTHAPRGLASNGPAQPTGAKLRLAVATGMRGGYGSSPSTSSCCVWIWVCWALVLSADDRCVFACVFTRQAQFEEHLQDTEVDAPMANLHLHNLQVGADRRTVPVSWQSNSWRLAAWSAQRMCYQHKHTAAE